LVVHNWLATAAFIDNESENIKSKQYENQYWLSQIFVYLMTNQMIPDEYPLLANSGFDIGMINEYIKRKKASVTKFFKRLGKAYNKWE